MTAFAPRDYQLEANAAVKKDWAAGVNRTAVVLPTGMGKTVAFAHLIKDNPRGRSLVLVHRDELAKQAQAKIHSIDPSTSVGIVKAERNDTDAGVIVGSVQTLCRPNRRAPITDVSLLVVDEAHHAAADTYMEVLSHFGAWESLPTVGYSATLNRNDDRALGEIWSNIAYERDIRYGIRHGHLVPPRGKAVTVGGLNLRSVSRSHGDFRESSLGAALIASNAGDVIAEAYHKECPGKRAVVFAPNVASAEDIAMKMNSAGIPTEVITGTTPVEERTEMFARFESGETLVLSNCMVLTEGWDAEHAEVAIIARATTSKSLYIQMVGRVLRPWAAGGKTEALILDVVGVIAMHDLASISDLTGGEIVPKDGELLTDAAKRIAKEREVTSAVVGELASKEVDLFRQRPSVWLKTLGGNWFIPTTDMYYTVFPVADGTYTVACAPAKGSLFQPGRTMYQGMTLDGAMEWAESDAEDLDPTISRRDRRWRSNPPSEGQLTEARRLKIPHPESLRRGALSDAISVHKASRVLDHRINKVRKAA